jgi:diguanylate cyclase (GGDEF)-like protein
MQAAAIARKRRARRRPGGPPGSLMPGWDSARVTTILLLVLAVAMVACAVFGLTVTQRDDARLEADRHAALQHALDDLHVAFGDVDRFDPGQLQLVERRAGLADLRFDADLTADTGREVQSLHDGEGRILGWFSWTPDRALIRAMNWLWGIVGAVGAALALCAFLATRATRRLGGSLARNIEAVRKLTSQDVLTSLPNRRVMLERLEQVMATRRSEVVAFALIDVDSFHEINDTLGRAGGDAMLINIAGRLQACLPADALFGRFEDDEFAVIAKSYDPQSAGKLADALAASLAAPIFMDQNWHISVSIGMAQAPEDGTTGDELHRRAALALRAAKHGGRGTMRRFVPQIQEEHSERRFFRRELETAIEKHALDVHYQPVVAAAGGGIVGVEALARWTHPTRGVIAPSMFIPLAEQSGLMIQLGEFVLRRALADAARWPKLFVSINLSPVQMRNRGIVDLLRSVLAESGIAASRIVLEVTESILIDNLEETQERLEALRKLGASVALDDFGSGYSSLNYLQKFPFDRLKIDRGFVASLGTSGTAGAIIQAIVTLGHALGMKVLAEGVETDEQRVLLRLAGCDEMQGYLFAKPRPAAAIDKALARAAEGRSAARRPAASAS